MNDNKSRDIFYAVVAVATLIVALIGATLAYFSMTATSGEGAVSAKAATVSINYVDGQSVIAQAENLIPVDFDIMQTLYRRNLEAINEQAETEPDDDEDPRRNLCQDGNNSNYEVCSVFRFTVSNDQPKTIGGQLRTENNEFTDLYYGIRDGSCTATAANEDQCWLVLDADSGDKYVKLSTCSNDSDTPCYTGETPKTYETEALRPLFGYDASYNFKTLQITAAEHSYDVVLFILNKENVAQDYDQGKTYRGNLYVETTDDDKIRGQLN